MAKWKERLKKIGKRVLPIVVSIAAGSVFPPAAGGKTLPAAIETTIGRTLLPIFLSLSFHLAK
ncbi:MAG: hypothetical protein J7L47_05065 [Candidatus Odinarchaeota archaeon]|nr:hypothetical protein [Candidatus Odinarchaeota archaeon]